MTEITKLANRTAGGQARAGRRYFYGEPTVHRPIYFPESLKARIERDALSRNVLDGTHDKWSLSRVVVDILLSHYGLPKPQTSASNGHGDDR